MELRLVQTNLNHCRDAQDLFWEFAKREDISMALVSEPYDVGRPGWRCDSSGRAAIRVLRVGRGDPRRVHGNYRRRSARL